MHADCADIADYFDARRGACPLAPERALFCEVIKLAFEDATKRTGPLQAKALDWLEFSDDFDVVAMLAGFDDPDALRAGIVRRIDQMRPGAPFDVPAAPTHLLGGRTLLTGLRV